MLLAHGEVRGAELVAPFHRRQYWRNAQAAERSGEEEDSEFGVPEVYVRGEMLLNDVGSDWDARHAEEGTYEQDLI
jgi:hypothetical protein